MIRRLTSGVCGRTVGRVASGSEHVGPSIPASHRYQPLFQAGRPCRAASGTPWWITRGSNHRFCFKGSSRSVMWVIEGRIRSATGVRSSKLMIRNQRTGFHGLLWAEEGPKANVRMRHTGFRADLVEAFM